MLIFRKIKQKLNWQWQDIRHGLGFGKSLNFNDKINIILVYHGIASNGIFPNNSRFISTETFEKHIAFFKQKANMISSEDFYKDKFSESNFNITLTFDDGYRNNLTKALPILEKYQIPATIFVTAIRSLHQFILWPDMVDLTIPFLPDEIEILGILFIKKKKNQLKAKDSGENVKQFLQQKSQIEIESVLSNWRNSYPFSLNNYHEDYYQTLTDSEIKLLSKHPLITIGAHGVYHTDLTRLSDTECVNELQKSKNHLENLIQKEVNAFAFPFGNYNENVIKHAENVGFTQLFALNKQQNLSHPFLRERFGINPYISFENQILAIKEGKY